MIDRLGQVLPALALLALAGAPVPATAAEEPTLAIGMLEIADDPRYEPPPTYAGIMKRPRGRPYDGASVALGESKIVGRALGVRFALERRSLADADAMAGAVEQMRAEEGIRFFVLDADAQTLVTVAGRTSSADVMLFNVSAPDDILRGAACAPHLLNVLPSDAMLADALAQFVVARRWSRVLVLAGPGAEDQRLGAAFARSAAKFGARIVESREFVLSNDPRSRGRNNVALLTGGPDHDVVFLADADGEFGRYVPYQTQRPRPVIGTEGLVADTWHWSWERHGAPQLNQRFEKRTKRRMQGADWAAWAAVKLVVEAAVRTRSTDFEQLAAFVRGPEMTLDGYKGKPLSFRAWSRQLRQAVFLRTHNAIIERAPLEGFLHQRETLDTLGVDERESTCRAP